jgi:hypothetical protein
MIDDLRLMIWEGRGARVLFSGKSAIFNHQSSIPPPQAFLAAPVDKKPFYYQ